MNVKMRILTLFLIAAIGLAMPFVALRAQGGDPVTATETPIPAVDGGQSTVEVEGETPPDIRTVDADGVAFIVIKVTVRTADGTPLSGKTVTLSHQTTFDLRFDPEKAEAISGADGVALITVRSLSAGQVIFTAAADGVAFADTATVNFRALPPNPAQSTLSASAPSVTANNVDEVTITAQLKTVIGLPAAGVSVTLDRTIAADANAVTVTPPSATTDANGNASFKVRSSVIQSVEFTLKDGNGAAFGSVTVAFTPSNGPVDATKSTLVVSPASPLLANGTDSFTVTATLRDATGTPVGGKTATLQPDPLPAGVTIVGTSGASDANGVITWTLKANQAATFAVSATVDGVTISAAESVTFNSVIDATKSEITAPTTAQAGELVEITVTVRNNAGMAVAGQPVTLDTNRDSDKISTINGITDGSGKARFTIEPKDAGTAKVQVKVGDVELPDFEIAITPPPPVVNVANSSVQTDVASVPVSGAGVTITVTVRDENNMALPGVAVTLNTSRNVSTPGTDVIAPSATQNTDVNGQAVFGLNSGVAGSTVLTVTADGTNLTPVGLTITFTTTFTISTAVDPAKSTVVLDTNKVAADGTAQINVTVTALDSSNTPLINRTVTLSSSRGGTDTIDPISGTTDGDGAVSFTVTSTTPGQATLTAVADSVLLNTKPKVNFGIVDPGTTVVDASPTSQPADGTSEITVTVTVKDADGKNIPNRSVQIFSDNANHQIINVTTITNASGQATFKVTSTVAGSGTITAIADGVAITDTATATFTAVTLTVDAAQSTVETTATSTQTGSSNAVVITVTAKTAAGVPISGRPTTLTGAGAATTIETLQGTTDGFGVAIFKVTGDAAGSTTFTAVVSGVTLNTKPVVTFTTPVNSGNSTTTGGGSTTAGASQQITITVRDASNNPVEGQLVTVTSNRSSDNITPGAPLLPPSMFTTAASSSSTRTDANGQAIFTFTASTAGTSVLSVSASGVTLPPIMFTVAAPAVDVGNSTVAAFPTRAKTGIPVNITVTVLDGLGAPLTGLTVSLTSSRGGTDTITAVNAVTNASGVANFTFISDTPSNGGSSPDPVLTAVVDSVTLNPLTLPVDPIVDGVNSTITPPTQNAFTGIPVQITVTARDSNAVPQPVANQFVQVNSTPSTGITITPAVSSSRTDVNGQLIFNITATAPGSYVLTATAGGTTLTQTASIIATVQVSAANSAVDGPPTGFTGIPITVSVTARDAGNNPVAGQSITLTSNRPANDSIVPPTATTNASGVATFTVTSNAVGTSTFTATAGSITITDTATTVFSAPPATALIVEKSHAGNFSVGANGTYSIAIFNSGAPTGPITLTDVLPAELTFVSAAGGGFTCANSGQLVTCINPTGLTLGQLVVVQIVVRPTVATTVTNVVSVTAGATTVIDSDITVIDVANPNTISETLSTVSASATTAPADNTTPVTITVQIKNTTGANIAGAQVTLQPNPDLGLTIEAARTLTTDANGLASFSVRASQANRVTFTVAASTSVSNVTLATRPVVDFGTGTAGTISEANSTVISDFISIPADNTTAATVTVTLRDANNNPVSGKAVTLRANPASSTVTINPTSGTSGADGTVAFRITASAQGQATFSAEATDGRVFFITQTATIQFTAPGTQTVRNPNSTPTSPQAGTQTAVARSNRQTITVPTGPIEGTVVAYRLRVRQGPGLDFPILGLLELGQKVSIIARDSRGLWYQIDLGNGGTAWISARWVRLSRTARGRLPVINPPGTTPIINLPGQINAGQNEGIGIVNTFLLRVRTGPGTEFQQIGLLREATEILLLGISPDRRWYLFRTADGTAWTSALFVRQKFVNGVLPLVELQR
jgi:hypothetical protein